jgi:adenylate cyclase
MWKRRNAYLASMSLAALLSLPCGATQPRALDDVRNFVFDSFQRAAPRPYDRETPVRVVGVDEESLRAFGQWPWPRTRLAELIDALRGAGAAVIAFDFVFAETDRISAESVLQGVADAKARAEIARALKGGRSNDAVFAQSIAAAPVVLGVALAGEGAHALPQKSGLAFAGDDATPFLPQFSGVVAPLPALAEAARGLGATNWLPDRDQIVRRVPLLNALNGVAVPALALEALRVAQGETTFVVRSSNASGQSAFGRHTGVNAIKVGALEVAAGAGADVRPHYSTSQAERHISAARVLRGELDHGEIDGRIIFVGALATALGDVRATPLEPVTPGVDIHAQIVESLVSGALLSRPDWAPGLEFLVAAASFLAIAALLYVAPPLVAAMVGVGAVTALFAGSFALFDQRGLLLDAAYPSATILVVTLVGAVSLWRVEQTAKRHVTQAFGKFVAPAVVARLAEHPDRLVLGGETRELSVLFSDVRDFTRLSEGMSARDITQFMNDYLTPMTDAVLEAEGTVDKYMGDAILAFWNAPLDVPDHPRKAASAALAMRAALERLNVARAARSAGAEPVRFGVGLHLGPCSVGNMGSVRRFDYSILGDTANLAARLDSVCKSFKVDIVASKAVQDAAPEFAWLSLGEARLLGRVGVTGLAALAGDANEARGDVFVRWRTAHDAMLGDYHQLRFDSAARSATALSETVASQWRPLYLELARRFLALSEQAPPASWTPLWTLDTK